MRDRVTEYITELQDRIVSALEAADPSAPQFKRDSWVRAQGGTGRSCVFAVPPPSDDDDGNEKISSLSTKQSTVLEKAGVNVSVVHGLLPPAAIKQMRADHSTIPFDPANPVSLPFFAAGISLVIHPRNPSAPTVHANYRYFEITDPADAGAPPAGGGSALASAEGKKPLAWWFGGGSDLTPSYLFPEDASHFHQTLKDACDAHGGPILHKTFKKWCDEYFTIPHRGGESRGVGGIFFDDLSDGPHHRLDAVDASGGGEAENARPQTPDAIFAFIRSCGDAFLPSYIPILEKRKSAPSTARMRRWQLIRRGRYVEFNLVHDRGTKFGLSTLR